MAVSRSQWLTSRNLVADWLTDNQAENKTKVSLKWQTFTIAAHPLYMAVFPSVVGLDTVGTEMAKVSNFAYTNRYYMQAQTGQPTDWMEDLWDSLATEERNPLIDEDTARPVGVTVGQGFTRPISPAVELTRLPWRRY